MRATAASESVARVHSPSCIAIAASAPGDLVNLTSDEDYGLIAGFLVDPKTNPQVLDVLFSDLMNRNRELQMPLFMNILKNSQHPQSQEVRDVLTILAGEDFGQRLGPDRDELGTRAA